MSLVGTVRVLGATASMARSEPGPSGSPRKKFGAEFAAYCERAPRWL